MAWFLYDNGPRHERVKTIEHYDALYIHDDYCRPVTLNENLINHDIKH